MMATAGASENNMMAMAGASENYTMAMAGALENKTMARAGASENNMTAEGGTANNMTAKTAAMMTEGMMESYATAEGLSAMSTAVAVRARE